MSRVCDQATLAYIVQHSDTIPEVIGDDTNVVDALIASERELAQYEDRNAGNEPDRALLHYATYIHILTALEEYFATILSTDVQPPANKIRYVHKVPAKSTSYANIKQRFEGRYPFLRRLTAYRT